MPLPDSNILYSKIVDMLNNPDPFPPPSDKLDLIVDEYLEDAKSSVSDAFEATNVDVKLMDDIIELVHNFQNLFPIKIERISNEPREKSS